MDDSDYKKLTGGYRLETSKLLKRNMHIKF